MPGPPFNTEQSRFYDENGYLVLRSFFEPAELEVWSRRFEQIAEGQVEAADGMLVMKDVMVAKGAVRPRSSLEAIAKIQELDSDPVLFDGYCRHPKLLRWVEAVTGPDIKIIHNMLVNKPPGVDGRHPLHQDLLYFPLRPADRIVATWAAIQKCTRENGCLVVVPGSHRGELREHENPSWEYLNFFYVGAVGVGADSERTHLEMEPGDVVLFHPLLLHGSGQNRTEGFRRAISCHYASTTCRFLPGGESAGASRPYRLVQGHEHPGCI